MQQTPIQKTLEALLEVPRYKNNHELLAGELKTTLVSLYKWIAGKCNPIYAFQENIAALAKKYDIKLYE